MKYIVIVCALLAGCSHPNAKRDNFTPSRPVSHPPAEIIPAAQSTVSEVATRIVVGVSATDVQNNLGDANDIEIMITGTEPNHQRWHYWCQDGHVIVTIKSNKVTDIAKESSNQQVHGTQ